MARVRGTPTGLAQAIAHFPERAALLRRLVLRDEGFRGLCEDYALARASLAHFEARPDAAERPEIAEYRQVIAELELEIETTLDGAGTVPHVSGPMHAAGSAARLERKPEE